MLITRNDTSLQLYNGDVGLTVRSEDGATAVVFARHDGAGDHTVVVKRARGSCIEDRLARNREHPSRIRSIDVDKGDATYARAVAKFGEQGVIDLLGVVGYYNFLAIVLNATRTPMPEGVPEPLKRYPN